MRRVLARVLTTFLYGGIAMGEEMRTSWPAGATLDGWLLTKTGSGTPRWALEPDDRAPSK